MMFLGYSAKGRWWNAIALFFTILSKIVRFCEIKKEVNYDEAGNFYSTAARFE